MALTLDDLAVIHIGITEELGDTFAQAARVCLDRHHEPPIVLHVREDETSDTASLNWAPATTRARVAWGDQTDVIEWGAVGVALAFLGHERELVAVGRAQRGSGADYYVAPAHSLSEDLEVEIRLEISGVDQGEIAEIRRRLAEKLRQLSRGDALTPGLAVVVGFGARAIHIATLES